VWVIKGLLFLSLLFILVYFFVTNADQTVDLDVFGQSFLGVSIYWLVVVCFLGGFATSFILAALRGFKTHRELSQLRRELVDREREIAELRTLPLCSDADAESDKGATRD